MISVYPLVMRKNSSTTFGPLSSVSRKLAWSYRCTNDILEPQRQIFYDEPSLPLGWSCRDHEPKTSWKTRNSRNLRKPATLLGVPKLLLELHPKPFGEICSIFQNVDKRRKNPGNTGPFGTIHIEKQGSWSMLWTGTQTTSTE